MAMKKGIIAKNWYDQIFLQDGTSPVSVVQAALRRCSEEKHRY